MRFSVKRIILSVMAVVMFLAIVFYHEFFLDTALGMGLLTLCVVVYVVLCLIWNRCPYCGNYLRKLSIFASYCPYCGEKFD